jgi:hypothetical protein
MENKLDVKICVGKTFILLDAATHTILDNGGHRFAIYNNRRFVSSVEVHGGDFSVAVFPKPDFEHTTMDLRFLDDMEKN